MDDLLKDLSSETDGCETCKPDEAEIPFRALFQEIGNIALPTPVKCPHVGAAITALAERFHMTLKGMKKPAGVLEYSGLVSTEKVGRVRTCKLKPRGLEEEAA